MEIEDPAIYSLYNHALINGQFYQNNQSTFLTLTPSCLILSKGSDKKVISFQTSQNYQFYIYENSWKLIFRYPLNIQLVSYEANWMTWDQAMKNLMIKYGFVTQFEVLRQLGAGSFGEVFLVRKFQNNQLYAAKIYEKQLQPKIHCQRKTIINQINLWRKLDHQNIVKLEEVYEDETSYYLIQEYVEGVTLSQFLLKSHLQLDRQYIMMKILEALTEISDKNVVHRDLSINNVLVSKFGEIKIIDFGFCTEEGNLQNFKFEIGTVGFIAPQYFIEEETKSLILSSKSDIFSAGSIFYTLIFKKKLFPGSSYEEVLKKNKKMKFIIPEESQVSSCHELNLLREMLDLRIKNRVDARSALKSKYFNQRVQISQPFGIDKNRKA